MVRRFCAAHQQEGFKIDQLLPRIAGKQVQIPKVHAAAPGIVGKNARLREAFLAAKLSSKPHDDALDLKIVEFSGPNDGVGSRVVFRVQFGHALDHDQSLDREVAV